MHNYELVRIIHESFMDKFTSQLGTGFVQNPETLHYEFHLYFNHCIIAAVELDSQVMIDWRMTPHEAAHEAGKLLAMQVINTLLVKRGHSPNQDEGVKQIADK